MIICILTCDKYSHIVPLTLKYLERAWPGHYPVEVVTNTKKIEHDNVVYLGEDRGWSNNLLKYVQDKTEPFILYLEECILVEVDRFLINECVQASRDPDVGLVRMYPCPGPTLPYSEHVGEIDKSLPYAISCQMSIWHPRTLRDILKKDETPWDFEIHGSHRAANYPYKFLGSYKSAVSYKEYTRRGELNPDALDWMAKNV